MLAEVNLRKPVGDVFCSSLDSVELLKRKIYFYSKMLRLIDQMYQYTHIESTKIIIK